VIVMAVYDVMRAYMVKRGVIHEGSEYRVRHVSYHSFSISRGCCGVFFAKNETFSYNKMQQVTHIDNKVEHL